VFGVQSFNTRLLRMLGRQHKVRDTHRAVYYANALGYDNFGCDLLYGLPKQTGKMLSADLDQMVDLAPPHISFYQLTVEPGTPLWRKVETGKLNTPDSDFAQALYQAGYERLTEAGWERYEVCSFARPGHECRHNLNYWTGGEYIGLGPSAHSFLDNRRYFNRPSLSEYLEALKDRRRPQEEDESGEQERMVEALMLGLRLAEGVNLAKFSQRFDRDIGDLINPEQYELLIESGHLIWDEEYLRLSDDALILADEITLRLVR
jgi:oxygen-independent coproporphyrinogen-3 oxidase